jgi:hypothetical protein
VDRLTYILDISPTSGNKFVPVGLAAAAAAMKDPQCAVMAQVSFWRLGGMSSQWSMTALVSVSIVCHDRGDRSNLQVVFLAFSQLLPCVWSLLEHKVYKKHCSVVDLVRPMMMRRTRRWHWLVFLLVS